MFCVPLSVLMAQWRLAARILIGTFSANRIPGLLLAVKFDVLGEIYVDVGK